MVMVRATHHLCCGCSCTRQDCTLNKPLFCVSANRKRGKTGDLRQCVWRSALEASDAEYTSPMLVMTSSMNGIFEWQSNHFDGQLRGDLVISKYNGGAYRVILTPDGKGVMPQSDPALLLVDGQGLDITQAPSGEMIEVRYGKARIWYHRPKETTTNALVVNSVFPRRGGEAGGSSLHIFGRNFDKNGASPTVTVGGKDCPVVVVKAPLANYDRIECTLPGGTGTVDIVVALGGETSIFQKGYRYIRGKP